MGPCFLEAGDYNADHSFWVLHLISLKGRVLLGTISKSILNVISSGQATFWPTDRQKIPDLIDFVATKCIPKEMIQEHSPQEIASVSGYHWLNWLNIKKILAPISSKTCRCKLKKILSSPLPILRREWQLYRSPQLRGK